MSINANQKTGQSHSDIKQVEDRLVSNLLCFCRTYRLLLGATVALYHGEWKKVNTRWFPIQQQDKANLRTVALCHQSQGNERVQTQLLWGVWLKLNMAWWYTMEEEIFRQGRRKHSAMNQNLKATSFLYYAWMHLNNKIVSSPILIFPAVKVAAKCTVMPFCKSTKSPWGRIKEKKPLSSYGTSALSVWLTAGSAVCR